MQLCYNNRRHVVRCLRAALMVACAVSRALRLTNRGGYHLHGPCQIWDVVIRRTASRFCELFNAKKCILFFSTQLRLRKFHGGSNRMMSDASHPAEKNMQSQVFKHKKAQNKGTMQLCQNKREQIVQRG